MRTLFVALVGAASLFGAVAVAGAASPPATGAAAQSPGERGGPDDPNCEDEEDNDGDGLIDQGVVIDGVAYEADPDCLKPGCRPSSSTPNKCFESNDDTPDPEPEPEGPPGDETCTDGIDNDQDGATDGQDSDCVVAPEPEGPPGDETCTDGIDNDQDGATDGADSDCIEQPGTEGPHGDPTCSDGEDNDADGATDDADSDCAAPAAENCTSVPDHGLLTPDTLGEELYNALVGAGSPIPPGLLDRLLEDPERNGLISGPLGDAFNPPPAALPAELAALLETALGDEVPCLVDLLIAEGVLPLPDV